MCLQKVSVSAGGSARDREGVVCKSVATAIHFAADLEGALHFLKKKAEAGGKQSSLLTDGLNDREVAGARIALAAEKMFNAVQQERRCEQVRGC